MAAKYTIKIQPNLSPEDAQKLENDLNKRFNNVSKKFGTNLGNSIKTAAKIGIGAMAAGIAGILATNPFDKINEKLNETLEKSDNIVTRAAQFGVTTAKFAEIASIANSVGMDIDLALQQFSGALNEARQYAAGDTTKNNALLNFINEKDVIDAFYAFSQEMSKLSGQERGAQTSRVFGDKMIMKLAEFMQLDIEDRKKQIYAAGTTPGKVAAAAERTANLEDLQAILKQRRENQEIIKKGNAISRQTIIAQDAQERAKSARETAQLSQYEIFAQQSALQERMAESLDGIRADITTTLLPVLQKIVEYLEKIIEWFRTLYQKVKNLKIFS